MSTFVPDRHIRRSGDDYAVQLAGLLPQGIAWPRDADGTLMKTVRGLAQVFGFVDSRAADLLERESDPRTTTELLTDWERNWGLPDPCFSLGQSIGDRRRTLVTKMTLQGGQSRDFFRWVAQEFEGQDDLNNREFSPFMVGVSQVGDTRNTPSEEGVNIYGYPPPPAAPTPPTFVNHGVASSGFNPLSIREDNTTARHWASSAASGPWQPGFYQLTFQYKGTGSTPRGLEISICDIEHSKCIDLVFPDPTNVTNTPADLSFGIGTFEAIKIETSDAGGGWWNIQFDFEVHTVLDGFDLSFGCVNTANWNATQSTSYPGLNDGSGIGVTGINLRPILPSTADYRWQLGAPEMRFYWTAHATNAIITWFRCTAGQCGVDPHCRITLPQDLDCLLQRWKPAHTEIVYDFTNLRNGNPMEGTP